MIENLPWDEVLNATIGQKTFFYLDPPYYKAHVISIIFMSWKIMLKLPMC
jgi:site-specific DNA-adenine methylase